MSDDAVLSYAPSGGKKSWFTYGVPKPKKRQR
jgi:hypothetical protein